MKIKKRILSLLITVCLIAQMLPQTAFATEGATIGTSGLCEHHTEHDETCGYVEGTEETPCTHEHAEDCSEKNTSCTHTHTEDCYPVLDSGVSGNEATPSDAAEPTACVHECSEESGCITEKSNCPHTHNENCGYVAEIPETPCGYVCEECTGQGTNCTCDTDDTDIHATDCPQYAAPKNPVCSCVEKCTEDSVNEFCDICAADYTACTGEGSTAAYSTFTPVTKSPVDNGKAIQMGTNAIDDPTVTTNGMFLLSEYLFDKNNVEFNANDSDGNVYQNSKAQEWCKAFATNSFSTAEQAAFLGVDKTDVEQTDSANGRLYSHPWDISSLTKNDRVFFLSVRELADYVGDYKKAPGLIAKTGESGSEWKVTLKDGNDFSSGASVSGTTALPVGYSATTLTISHAALNDISSDYTHVTAALTDASGNLLYYGSINSDPSKTSSTVTIPTGLSEGTYTLSVYGEDWNDPNYTDYATGTPYTVALTVDSTAPTLAEGAVSRTSDTEATVKFTSDETGTYYYAVVESGAQAPTIDTSATGTACDTSEQTISLTTLTAGAKDIYVVVKDAAGNVSSVLRIEIPAYAFSTIQIFVKVLTAENPTLTFNVSPTATIAEIKEKICSSKNIPVEKQKLIFQGKTLENNKTLQDHSIGKDSTLHLMIAPTITTGGLSDGTVGTAYSQTLTADGYTPAWSIESGSLPAGLTLNSDGTISGTPTAAGTFTFTVKAENGAGSDTKELTITVQSSGSTHSHNWTGAWGGNDTHHWRECANSGCDVTENSGKGSYGTHVWDNACDTNCNTCGYTRTITHSYGTVWSKNASGHWYECSICGDKKDSAAHTPGAAATETTAQTCTVCGYEIAPALGHNHSYGAWQSNGDGTHTRTCSTNSSHTENENCSGGTATCQSPATCSVCNTTYGGTDSSNHTGGTEVRDKVDATTTSTGYTGDTYCLGCNTKIKTGTTILATGSGGGGTGGGTGTVIPTPDTGDDTPAEEIPTSPATGDTEYITYTVQKGDTLWVISRKYGCTITDIVAANSGLIKDPDLIYAGWQLTIPQAGATGTDNTPDAILPDDKKTTVYIVKQGDTLWAISRKYGCTVELIVALNGELITDPDLIFAGWELKVPQE